MVSYGTCILGKYPRTDQTWDAIKKHQADPSSENQSALEHAYKTDTQAFIRLQKEEQMSPVIDGSLSWDDLLKPYTENLDGVKIGGIERWYETNTFYFTPIITGKVGATKSILPRYVRLEDLKAADTPWSVTVISPYTFAHLSKDLTYTSKDELMLDIAEAQAQDVKALAEEGCAQINLLEPEPAVRGSLGLHISKDEIHQWREAIRIVFSKANLTSALFLCYGNGAGLIEDLLDFPVDYLGFDLARTSAESLTQHKLTKGLMLGALYSDFSLRADLLQEEPAKIADLVRRIVPQSNGNSTKVYITPNHELSTVSTRSEADQRLKSLGSTLKILGGAN